MRPARKGPENKDLDKLLEIDRSASMRPARKGPENYRQGGNNAAAYALQ